MSIEQNSSEKVTSSLPLHGNVEEVGGRRESQRMPAGQERGHTVYFSLGSNLGNKRENLNKAIKLMEEQIGVLVRQSAFLATEPWGFQSDNSFVNAAICMETELDPFEVLERTQKIERDMGRTIKSTDGEYHDRIIDIDILLYDDLKINTPRLTIPHPLMEQRDFVMIPLREILK